MWMNLLGPRILVTYAIIIVFEGFILSPNPQPIVGQKMEWREVDKLDANEEPIWAPDGNHYVTERK
jgi:hypothetical protein